MGQKMASPQKPVAPKQWKHLDPDETALANIRSILLQWFPPELIEVILDFVDDWPTHLYSKDEYLDGDAVSGQYSRDPDDGNVVDWCYMMTPPIQTGGRKVIKVVFVTRSHDQGWATFAEWGTYRQSNTWFEAGIFRLSDTPTPSLGWVDAVEVDGPVNIARLRIAEPEDEDAPGPGYYTEIGNPTNKSTRWRIQRNLTANIETLQHRITWKSNDIHRIDDAEEDLSTGAGRGKGFLELLEDGDRIAIFSRAKQALWRNHVDGVDIYITYKS
ncbi:hypothetical protein ONZ45_g12007 [Pleurotus djamor]|nr:hypothetical protein ONZ45_g14282 [Pleurotus djamor]KAJ8501855.1 hypothetical protein ONZ45_g12007 [Pleurotus djamor]